MKIRKTIIAAAVAAVFSAAATAQNMGFEDGNTTGWTSTTLSAVGSTTTQAGPNTWVINPYGNYMGRLQIQSGNYNQMATALGLTSASSSAITTLLQQQAQVSGGSPNPTTAGWVTREVTLTAGQTFTLAWQYVSVDYVPFNDGSIATLTQSGTTNATVNNYNQQYALLGFTNPGTGDYSTGSYGATGWQVATFQVAVDGTYTLGFGVFNLGDTALSPVLYIDEVQGTTTKNGVSFGAVAPNNSTAPSAVTPPPTPPAPTTVSSVASGTTVDTSNLASAVTVNGGTIQIATNNVTLTNTFTADTNGMTVDQNGNTVDFSGIISGSGGVTISNTGTGGGVTFSAVNTYTGTTTVNNGAGLTNTGTIAGAVTNLGSFTNTGTVGNVTNGFNGDGNTAVAVNSGTTGNVTNYSSFANSGTTGNVTNVGGFTNTGTVGSVTNTGVFNNNAGGTVNELSYNNHIVNNNGTINTVTYNGGTVINNAGATIGSINNNEAHGTFHNWGTVTGNVTTHSTFNNNEGSTVQGTYNNFGTLNNAGTVNALNNAGATNNTGTIETLSYNNYLVDNNSGGVINNITYNGGTVNNNAGGTIGTINNTESHGNFNNSGTVTGSVTTNSTFNNNEGGIVQGLYTNNGTVNNSGTLTTVENNNLINNAGTITTVTNNEGGTIVSTTGSIGTLVNNGTFDISGITSNQEEIFGETVYSSNVGSITGSGSVLTGVGNNYLNVTNGNGTFLGTISGEGGIVVTGGTQTLSGVNTYTGSTLIGQGATLNISGNGDISSSEGVLNAGTFNLNNNSNLAGIWNEGTSSLNGTGTVDTIINDTNGTVNINNSTTVNNIANLGTINIAAGIFDSVLNDGVINVNGSSTFTNTLNNGTLNANAGTFDTIVNSGTLNTSGNTTVTNTVNDGTMNINGGSFDGIVSTGTVNLNSSTASIGTISTFGTFNITGAGSNPTVGGYWQGEDGTTVMNGNQLFTTTGNAILDGNLTINNSNTQYGRYDVMSIGGARVGEFSSLTSSGVNDYLKYSGNNIKLYVTPSSTATQSSINAVGNNLGNAINLQSGTVTSGLGNDCNLFGESGSCISVNFNQSQAAGGDLQSGGITIGKRIDDNWRLGVFTNSPFNSTSIGSVDVKSNTAYGGYVGWNKNADGKGLGITASVAQGNGSMKITRNGPEVGVGTSNTNTTAYQVRATYAMPVTETVTVTPYAGVRRTETNVSGYTEQGPVFPLTVNGTRQTSTDIIAGATVSKQLTEKLSGNVSAGIIQRIEGQYPTLTGTSEIGRMSTFSGTVSNNGSTNPVFGAGLNYSVDKTTRVGVNAGIQQNGSNANITSIGITLTKGF